MFETTYGHNLFQSDKEIKVNFFFFFTSQLFLLDDNFNELSFWESVCKQMIDAKLNY